MTHFYITPRAQNHTLLGRVTGGRLSLHTQTTHLLPHMDVLAVWINSLKAKPTLSGERGGGQYWEE